MASPDPRSDPRRFVDSLSRSGLTIYDPIEVGHPNLWIPAPDLEALLDAGLRGMSLTGLPLRTRSKVVKEKVCRVLGYTEPPSFRRTQPRFPGQMFDTYIQKSNNLQIWNEELAPSRRYVLIRVDKDDRITRVKVVTGDALAKLDTTGTLTQKYQARCIPREAASELVVESDTARLLPYLSVDVDLESIAPIQNPHDGQLLPIRLVYERLGLLLGRTIPSFRSDQERSRGTALHRLVCEALGYGAYQDDGQFPDIRHQLLEVKFQTSPTIDLGLVTPASTEPLDIPQINDQVIRHCDVRYAVFYADTDNVEVALTHLFVTTGEAFLSRFPQFRGKVLNRKLQIPLPRDFFDR